MHRRKFLQMGAMAAAAQVMPASAYASSVGLGTKQLSGLMIDAAKTAGINLTLIPSIAALMDEWVTKGYGHNDWSVIAKDSI